MAQSLSDVYIHLTFSTYLRRLYLDAESRSLIFPYVVTILKNLRAPVLQIGGADEHIHILFRLPKDARLMDLIRIVKSDATKFLKTKGVKHQNFGWQAGYCALSVSPRSIDTVIRYISNQEKHHRTESYQDEVLRMLRESNTDFDERYLWD
ncbi:MAG: transposase [Bacteroidota bacterium]